jgi:hypothetical protein
MNNNKLKNTTSAMFIAAVLVAGTFAMVSPLTVYAQQYGQDSYYPSDPGMNDKSHSKIQKADCDNKNINVNGVDLTQRQDLVDNTLAGSADDASVAGQELSPEEAFAAISGSGDPLINAERNIVNVCINDNDNDIRNTVTATQTQPGTGGGAETSPCGEAIENCFRTALTADQFAALEAELAAGTLTVTIGGVTVTFDSFEEICIFLKGLTPGNEVNLAVDIIVTVGLGIQLTDAVAEALFACINAAILLEV